MARYKDSYRCNTCLCVGNLSSRTHSRDLEHIFSRYGRVRDVEMKRDHAFVEFSGPRDADDARYNLDGIDVYGRRITVEFARGVPRVRYPSPFRGRSRSRSFRTSRSHRHNLSYSPSPVRSPSPFRARRRSRSVRRRSPSYMSSSQSPPVYTSSDESPYTRGYGDSPVERSLSPVYRRSYYESHSSMDGGSTDTVEDRRTYRRSRESS